METAVKKFIIENFEKTVRVCTEDKDTVIGLPKPYTVPCIEDAFQEMYYWDTYFTNVGLLLSGNVDQAKNNVENMSYLINRYGKMLNGNRTYYLNRSQPPFFSQMVREIFEADNNRSWLEKIYPAVVKEYDFWQKERTTPCGLQRYYGDGVTPDAGVADDFCNRCGLPFPKNEDEVREYTDCFTAFAESGWDCTSRFGLRAHKFCPVDLNSLLFGMESNLAFFAKILCNGEEKRWSDSAEKRRSLMNTLMWNESEGAYFDYDFEKREKGTLFSAAAFYPLFLGVADEKQAKKTVSLLSKIEMPFGIACCENKSEVMSFQWDYPNGWACLHYIVIKGLQNYGYKNEAKRIAGKYTALVERVFSETGNLWEKYDVVNGTVPAVSEYGTPTMMGWSAGVYLYALTLSEL